MPGSFRNRCVSRSPSAFVEIPDTIGLRMLVHDRRRDRPVLVEVDLQRRAAAIGRVDVEVVFDELCIVDVKAVADAADRVIPSSGSVTDVAAIGRARRRRCRCNRHRAGRKRLARNAILSATGRLIMPSSLPPTPPCATVLISRIDPAVGHSKLRLVGDDADRARFARCAVQACPAGRRGSRSGRCRRCGRRAFRRSS